MAYHIAILNFPEKGGACNEAGMRLHGGRGPGAMLTGQGGTAHPGPETTNHTTDKGE